MRQDAKTRTIGGHIVSVFNSRYSFGRLLSLLVMVVFALPVLGQDEDPVMIPAPDRQAGEGEGPFTRLIIREIL
jgi:hypothetical protein